MSKQKSLFETKFVPGKPGSGKLFDEEFVYEDVPVACLGIEFKNDTDRRNHFTKLLRERLKDPEFRLIEGFPLGEDEDILALSDPPYYTACPNPWINDFIGEWEAQRSEKPKDYHYHREPFVADVSEGKTDQFYRAHTYHTKVPHKAIMRYILHYTEPNEIIFDGFCGSGMTGVAGQMCGDKKIVESLGYKVGSDGTILQEETDKDGKKTWKEVSKLGERHSLLNDLAPSATFMAAKYNLRFDSIAYERCFQKVLNELQDEYGWMYETLHNDGKTKGKINYTVWSEIFSCSECTGEIVFLKEAFDTSEKKVLDNFPCPHCGTTCTKRNLELLFLSKYDSQTDTIMQLPKRSPIIINSDLLKFML